jgi:hypothetical protein
MAAMIQRCKKRGQVGEASEHASVKRRRVSEWATPPGEEVLGPPWAAFVACLPADMTRLIEEYREPDDKLAIQSAYRACLDDISTSGAWGMGAGWPTSGCVGRGLCPEVHRFIGCSRQPPGCYCGRGCPYGCCPACQDPENPDCGGRCLV